MSDSRGAQFIQCHNNANRAVIITTTRDAVAPDVPPHSSVCCRTMTPPQTHPSFWQSHRLCQEDGCAQDGSIVRQQTEKGRTIKSNGFAHHRTPSKFITPHYYCWYLSAMSLTILVVAAQNSGGVEERQARGGGSTRSRMYRARRKTMTRPRAAIQGPRSRTRTATCASLSSS